MSKDPKNILKIAVVDDSDYIRKELIDTLEKNGFEVVGQAASAESAMSLISTTQANLFLIDVVMPKISGMELSKKIKEVASRPIFIIMMSNLDSESIIIETISSGANDFLAKPLDENSLIRAITKIGIDLSKESL